MRSLAECPPLPACLSTSPLRSVRFALLHEEGQRELLGSLAGPSGGAPLDSVQLRSRHWVIRNARGGVESEVRGEAVVGEYPLLRPGARLRRLRLALPWWPALRRRLVLEPRRGAAVLSCRRLPPLRRHSPMPHARALFVHAASAAAAGAPPSKTCPLPLRALAARSAAAAGAPPSTACPLTLCAHAARSAAAAGAPEFSYQSCTHQREPRGSMEGSFAFVEGTLRAPRRELRVACAPFRLDLPDVVY